MPRGWPGQIEDSVAVAQGEGGSFGEGWDGEQGRPPSHIEGSVCPVKPQQNWAKLRAFCPAGRRALRWNLGPHTWDWGSARRPCCF